MTGEDFIERAGSEFDHKAFAMEIRQINYFVRVAELGSISKAAVALNIAQSAVSRQIRKLEEELDVQLFHRNGRGVMLTPAGTLLLEHGRTAADLLDHATQEINLLRSSPGGSAVVGVPPTIGRMFTIPFSRRFRAAFPNANLRIVESFTGNLVEWLFAGRIDVALLYDDPTVRSAIFEPVVEEDLVCIGISGNAPALTDGAVTVEELCRLPLILPGPPHGLRRFMDDMVKNVGLRLSVSLEVDALHSMLEAVRAGLGYTVLPVMAIKREPKLLGFRSWPITTPELTRLIYVATAGQRSQAIPTQPLARLVRAQVLDLMEEAEWRSVRRAISYGEA